MLVMSACDDNMKRTLDDCPVVAHVDENGVVVCNLASIRDTIDLPVSTLFSDFEIVRLENSDDALINDGSVWVSEHHIGFYSYVIAAYKLFDRTGKYLGIITSKGPGPDEFIFSIYDSHVDRSEGKIYLLPWMASKILVFDLQGKALTHIPLPYTVYKGRMKINTAARTLVMHVLPFSDTPCVVWKQDFDGNVLQSVPAGQFVIDPSDYSNEVFSASCGNDLTYYYLARWAAKTDSLYHYSETGNTLSPAFTVQLIDEEERHDYMELPAHYLIYMSADRPDFTKALVDKRTLKGAFFRLRIDMLGDIPGDMIVFDNGYGIANMHPSDLKEQLETALARENLSAGMRQKLTELNAGITDNDNNIVLIGKLK
jgi:hypothetical protein